MYICISSYGRKNTMTINIIYVCSSEGQLINNLGSQGKQFSTHLKSKIFDFFPIFRMSNL